MSAIQDETSDHQFVKRIGEQKGGSKKDKRVNEAQILYTRPLLSFNQHSANSNLSWNWDVWTAKMKEFILLKWFIESESVFFIFLL